MEACYINIHEIIMSAIKLKFDLMVILKDTDSFETRG